MQSLIVWIGGAPAISFVIDFIVCCKKWWYNEYSYNRKKNWKGFFKELGCKLGGTVTGMAVTFGVTFGISAILGMCIVFIISVYDPWMIINCLFLFLFW